jgi:hypothetical protein
MLLAHKTHSSAARPLSIDGCNDGFKNKTSRRAFFLLMLWRSNRPPRLYQQQGLRESLPTNYQLDYQN